MKISHVILIVAGGVFLSSCAHVGNLDVEKPPDIIAQVVHGSTQLKITTPGSPNCRVQNQGNGCVYIDKGDTGLITFKLAAPKVWVFNSFEVCKGNTDANKVCSLNLWERMEFVATDDAGVTVLLPDEFGTIELTLLSSSLYEFILLDQNRIDQEYYYRVEACNSSTGKCLWADPPIENKGTN